MFSRIHDEDFSPQRNEKINVRTQEKDGYTIGSIESPISRVAVNEVRCLNGTHVFARI